MLYFLIFIMVSLNGVSVGDMDLGRRVQLTSDIVSIKQKNNTSQNNANGA